MRGILTFGWVPQPWPGSADTVRPAICVPAKSLVEAFEGVR